MPRKATLKRANGGSTRMWRMALLIGAVTLGGCADIGLRDLRGEGPGPDEFLVIPSKPLTPPENFTDLPAPTPGGSNITDPTPVADGIAALGGQASDPNGGIPAADGALLAQANRYGTNNGIRETLAQEDADFRRRRGRFSQIRLFRVDRYREVYQRQELDAQEVNDLYQRAGIRTPTAPPSGSR